MFRKNAYWILLLVGCVTTITLASDLMPVKLALDWTPNTNHTGIYVAQELGYFAEEGLQVEIVQPGPTTSIQLTGTGKVEFGVSMQEYVTMARSQNVPVVSIAAVIQHNTSGFAALKEKNIQTALDFEHKRYGGWGSALEEAMIQTAMGVAGADFTTVTQVNIGMVDFTTAATRDLADFFWIFYGWEGIHAELEALDFTFIPLIDISDIFDYYTPIIISSEGLIDQNPDLVRRFLRALSKGYQYAIDAPVGAAEILLKHVPELDQELVRVSQAWLAGKYAEGAEIWGVQCHETWQRFMEWAVGSGLIETEIDVDRAFTNAFLPQASDD